MHVVADQWNFINRHKIKTLRRLPSISDEKRQALIDFYRSIGPQLRGDFQEAAELCLVLLGAGHGIVLKKPSSDNNSRWLSKFLFGGKAYMFAPELGFTSEEVKMLQDFLHFCVYVYLPAWFKVPFITEAAITDIEFAKGLVWYKKFRPNAVSAIMRKMNNHSWYLGQELSWMCIFSHSITDDQRKKVLEKLDKTTAEWNERGIKLHGDQSLTKKNDVIIDISTLKLEDLVDGKSRAVMELLGVSHLWEDDTHFERDKKIVEGIPCTNDVCERAIHLANSHQDQGPRTESARQDYYIVADTAQKIPRHSLTALNKYYATK